MAACSILGFLCSFELCVEGGRGGGGSLKAKTCNKMNHLLITPEVLHSICRSRSPEPHTTMTKLYYGRLFVWASSASCELENLTALLTKPFHLPCSQQGMCLTDMCHLHILLFTRAKLTSLVQEQLYIWASQGAFYALLLRC